MVGISSARLPGRGLRATSPGALQASPSSGGRAAPRVPSEAAQDAEKPCTWPRCAGVSILGPWERPGLPCGCSHARPGVPPSERRSRSPQRQPRPRAQGVRRLTRCPRANTRAHTHTHAHAPLRWGRRLRAASIGSGIGDVQLFGPGRAQARPHSQNTLIWGQATKLMLKMSRLRLCRTPRLS